MSVKQDQETLWQEHLAQAESHPTSQMAYCREVGIEPRKLYAARERIKSRLKRRTPLKSKQSQFLPVTVAPTAASVQSMGRCTALPNPEWVAEVMLHLVRGLS